LLLVAAILILALDIRRGLPVFVIALCAIGWGEIAQYVRSEFIRIKSEPYLDSGRAIGMNGLELAVRQILPNVLPVLTVIALLETGAVLMILGELGFLGIYIGGGLAIQVGDTEWNQHFSIPEWGSMLAASRSWARSRPWMPIFPAIAFFIAVTGFNLLGEGLRRLIDRGLFNPGSLLTWRSLSAIAIVSAACVQVVLTLGPAPSYQQLAGQVSEADLISHVEYLGAPEMNGRAVGSPEAYEAAQYVERELASYGLETLVREVPVTIAQPVEPTTLAIIDERGEALNTFTRLVDYSETLEGQAGSGQAEAPVALVLFDPQTRSWSYQFFRGMDLRGRIAMVLASNVHPDFGTEALIRGAEGVVIVSLDTNPRNQVLSPGDQHNPSIPIFRISYATADAILSADGLDLARIRDQIETMDTGGQAWAVQDLSTRLRMDLELGPPQDVTLYNIFGMLYGSDAFLATEMVVISCHYDGLGRTPDGILYPGADENASGTAVMLEVARLWQEEGFQPRRTVVFAAWGGGELRYSGAHEFATRPSIFRAYDLSAIIHLDRLGSATGEGLAVRQLGDRGDLFDLFISSASDMGTEIRGGAAVRHPYHTIFRGEDEPLHGGLIVTWGDPPPALAEDTVDTVAPSNLSLSAQAVNLTLIVAAHEPLY
jgi:hypothetical protein